MIAKIIIFTLISLALNSLSEKDFSIKAVYETTEPNENITLIHSYCDITKLNIDGEFIEISPDERNNFFYLFDNIGYHTVFFSLDFSKCQYLSSMFYSNKNLVSIKFLDEFKGKNITSTSYLFGGCFNLTSLDISNLNTEYVVDMSNMFANCWKLTSIDLSNFNTKNVKNMNWMFEDCQSLKSIDLIKFDTSSVTRIDSMFWNSKSLTSIDMSHFDLSKITSFSRVFCDCESLVSIKLPKFKNVTNIET